MGGLVLFVSLLTACSGDDGVSPPQRYSVGGSVTGLQNGSVVLQNNGSDDVSMAADGAFRFTTSVPAGTTYSVAVASQPPGQTCQVSSGSGTVGEANVADVVVVCQPTTYTIGGMLSGLDGGELTLRNNGADDLPVTADGGFTFAAALASGSTYSVEVAAQPAGQACAVTDGSGVMGDSDVTSVTVSCEALLFAVGGTIGGLAGGTAVLQNNGGDDLTLTANGEFTFATPLESGAVYEVSVVDQPSGQLCMVDSGTGSVGDGDVTAVVVTCGDSYTVGGTVTGLVGGSVLLQNNGGDDLAVTTNGDFTFAALLSDGSGYDVTVAEQPSGQTCVVINGNGMVAGVDVVDVQVVCNAQALSSKIVFHSNRDGDFEVFVMNPDGSNVVQLTDNDVDDYWPVVSPDGTKIAFWTGRDGNQEIYVMAVDGSSPTRVTTSGAADRQPAWSSDGERIAFHRVVNGTKEIYTIKVDGTGINRLTNNTFDDSEPAWSPDGLLIAFMTNRDGNNEIYTMNASDGSNPRNVTNNPGRDGKPDWSPDGSRILFDRNNTSIDPAWLGDAEIMCMSADGSGQVQLTTDTSGYVDAQARWSANGARLVFNSRSATGGVVAQLHVGRLNSCAGGISDLTRVTTSGSTDAAADWSPR